MPVVEGGEGERKRIWADLLEQGGSTKGLLTTESTSKVHMKEDIRVSWVPAIGY